MFEKAKIKREIDSLFILIKKCSSHLPIYNSNRDFSEFVFSFYCLFIIDYTSFINYPEKRRGQLVDKFLHRIMKIRDGNFTWESINYYYTNYINAFFHFINTSNTKGEFYEKSSNYMNAMLTVSIDSTGYAYGKLEDLDDMLKTIKPNIYTKFIEESIVLNTSMFL